MPISSLDREKYPNAFAIADGLDLRFMQDVDVNPDSGDVLTLYYIGASGDYSVGIFSTRATPFFQTPDDLEAFCVKHRAEYDSLMEMDELPEKLFWEEGREQCSSWPLQSNCGCA